MSERTPKRRNRRLMVAVATALVMTVLQPISASGASAPAPPGHELPGADNSVLWKQTDGAPPGKWIFTTEEEVGPGCGVTDAVVLPDGTAVPNRGHASLYNGELWTNAGLGKPTQVQLTAWQVNYLDPASQIAVPWVPTGTVVVQGRGRVDSPPNRPTDAKAVVEVLYTEVRHRAAGNPSGEVDVVKWAVRVNLDRTIDFWDRVSGDWSYLATIPNGASLSDVPVTARFTTESDAAGDRYVGSLEVLVGSERHEFPMAGREPGNETKTGWDPSITLSLENSTRYDGVNACRPRTGNERAITRYQLDYSGVLSPADPMDGCSRGHLPCLPADRELGPRCGARYASVDLAYGDTPTNGDDVIVGTAGPDVVNSLDGNDWICGLGGADNLTGGRGNDVLSGGNGDDRLAGWAGRDRLYGNDGNDVLYGNRGNDQLFGGADNDYLSGGLDDDEMNGGWGDDRMRGLGGNDQMTGAAGNDTLWGGDGNDRLAGWAGSDTLMGESGDDHLYGNRGNDTLDGGNGEDVANGGLDLDSCSAETTRHCP